MRWQLLATTLALCASATQIPLNPLRPAQDVLPGASLTVDSELELASIGTEFIEITHAAFPVRLCLSAESPAYLRPARSLTR